MIKTILSRSLLAVSACVLLFSSCVNEEYDLDKGKCVLFTGTACQVNGLSAYLQKEYPNLFLIDIVCHGVPSIKLWEKYIEGVAVSSIAFRAKDDGWSDYGMKINNSIF